MTFRARGKMIMNQKIKELVSELETAGDEAGQKAGSFGSVSSKLRDLVNEVQSSCSKPEVKERYEQLRQYRPALSSYPLDDQGYAKAFDPLREEEEMFQRWKESGIVVGSKIASRELCEETILRLREVALKLSNEKFDILDPSTFSEIPKDQEGVALLSRGFFELYHDDSIAELRQLVRLYLQHVVIWGQAELWSSFDRFGLKLPHHPESAALPLHVDQNPLQDPEFKTVQGVLALSDCPIDRGTFVAVPGSKTYFHEYEQIAGQGEYVQLDQESDLAKVLLPYVQPIPIRSGDAVTWDSRTTHSNSANISDQLRAVAYVAAGPVPMNSTEAIKPRLEALSTGLGSNQRGSLMHASMRPRFTAAQAIAKVQNQADLTYLGKLLYGIESYGQVR